MKTLTYQAFCVAALSTAANAEPTTKPSVSSEPTISSVPSLQPSISSEPSTSTSPSGRPSLSIAPSFSNCDPRTGNLAACEGTTSVKGNGSCKGSFACVNSSGE